MICYRLYIKNLEFYLNWWKPALIKGNKTHANYSYLNNPERYLLPLSASAKQFYNEVDNCMVCLKFSHEPLDKSMVTEFVVYRVRIQGKLTPLWYIYIYEVDFSDLFEAWVFLKELCLCFPFIFLYIFIWEVNQFLKDIKYLLINIP